jgi:hypothetical protein
MRGTTKILIAFGIVFVVVSGAIIFIISHVTSSITSNAFRTRDAASAMSGMGDTILWTAVPIVVITLVGIAVVFVVMRRVMGANKRLVASGVPGTAVVLSVRDTGTTINNTTAVFDVGLEVTLPGQQPYQARAEAMLGRMSWGALQPGMTVAVKVDPNNAMRVAIDWNVGAGGRQRGRGRMQAGLPGLAAALNQAGRVATPGGSFAIPGVAGAMQASAVRSAEDIVAQGERAEGTIQAVSHTGATAAQMAPGANLDADKADDPMIYVAMQVQPRQGAAFASQGIFRVPKRKLAALAIGRKVPVAFLPGQPETATIDWSRL